MSSSDDKRRLQAAEAELARQQDDHQRRLRDSPLNASRGEPAQEKPPSRLLVFFTVTFYLIAAIVMVFANKAVLNSVAVPLSFLCAQLIVAVLLLHASSFLGYFKLPSLEVSTCKSLAPLVCINVLGLAFNTFCLQYVDASFYQVARGLVLPFTTLASYLVLGTKSSRQVLIAVAIVCCGFMYGVSSERFTVSHLGVLLGVFSSMTTSIHAIVVKRSLAVVPGAIDLAYYSNLLSALVIFPFVIVTGETSKVTSIVLEAGIPFKTLAVGTLVTGVFGFLICIAGFLSIKITSPVTHMVSSAVRGVLQTVLGYWVFGDVMGSGRVGGIGFILIGSLYYTWVKDQELTQSKQHYQASNSPHVTLNMTSTSTQSGMASGSGSSGGGGGGGEEEYELTRTLTDSNGEDEDEKEFSAAERALKSHTSNGGSTSPDGTVPTTNRRSSVRY